MAMKVFAVGVPPTALDLNTYLIQQQHVIKTADETYTSVVMQDDNHLFMPVTANTTYFVQGLMIYTCATANDMAFRWSAPSGTVFDWISDALGSSATSTTDVISRTVQGLGSLPNFGAITSSYTVAPIKGMLTVGSNSGTLKATWALGVTGSTVTMKAGSYFMARRMI